MDSNDGNGKKQLWATLTVLVAIALLAGGGVLVTKNNEKAAEPSSAQMTNTSSSNASRSDSSATYKDGTYTTSSSFSTPGGPDKILLSVTIKNGVVSGTSAQTTPPDDESEQFDQNFIDAYKEFVVGKRLRQVEISRVAGASLTTQGFNDALEQIANQAKV